MGLDLQPDGLTAASGLAGHCQLDKKYLKKRKDYVNKVTPVCVNQEKVYIWCKHQANFHHQTTNSSRTTVVGRMS